MHWEMIMNPIFAIMDGKKYLSIDNLKGDIFFIWFLQNSEPVFLELAAW